MKQARSKCLSTNEAGTIAPMFGLMMLVFMFVIGVAIDGSRAFQASSEVTTALDAAAMAAAKEMRNNSAATDDELQALAASYFASNLETTGGVGIIFDQLTLTSDRVKGSVTLSVDTRLPTNFSRLLAVNEIQIPRSATAIDGTREIEMSMMLDLSGLMGGSKISDLQVAAKELVKIVLGANDMGAKNRIAIAPYSSAVNVGSKSGPITGLFDTNKCVTERTGSNAFKDKGPSGGLLNKKRRFVLQVKSFRLLIMTAGSPNTFRQCKQAVQRRGILGLHGPGISSRPSGRPSGRRKVRPSPIAVTS